MGQEIPLPTRRRPQARWSTVGGSTRDNSAVFLGQLSLPTILSRPSTSAVVSAKALSSMGLLILLQPYSRILRAIFRFGRLPEHFRLMRRSTTAPPVAR